MANWSQSHFLQSLGWATLNSFWQMALLWCIFMGACQFVRISSERKYQLSVSAIVIGFAWFLFTFFYYYQSTSVSTVAFFNQTIKESDSLLQVFLLSASVAYLSLLIFPAYRLYKNWKFVQKIKKEGLGKAEIGLRLFVQKISAHLGIGKKVQVYISDLVHSPVTIGYLKPIILLPIAAINRLSTTQVEAILLHELSHIRRYDYLVNLMISIITTLLYFNPFVKLFLKSMEEERENCCDEVVLQFGYDKVGYASALLSLEKAASQPVLVLGATGKKHLLHRIEKIVGMEKKKGFRINHFAGILAALFFIILFNSFLIIRDTKRDFTLAYKEITSPLNFFNDLGDVPTHSVSPVHQQNIQDRGSVATTQGLDEPTVDVFISQGPDESNPETATADPLPFLQASNNEIDASLTTEQKQQVKSAVDASKKAMTTLQWQEINKNIAEVLNQQEREQARKEYVNEMEKAVNWKNIEENMKAGYDQLNWEQINMNIARAKAVVQIDSIQKAYTAILSQLDKAKVEAYVNGVVSVAPLPDHSVTEIKRSTEEMRKKLDSIKALRNPKPVVRL